MVTATAPFRTAKTVISADAGYHAEANLKGLAESKVAPDIQTRVIAGLLTAT